MSKLSFIAAAVLAASSFAVSANDQSVAFTGNVASFASVGSIFQGGDDVLTFTGLAAGTYEFTLTLSGQNGLFTGASLNGIIGTTASSPGGKVFFGFVEGTSTAPFVLTLNGLNLGTQAKPGLYSGELTVTAVPEPTTYALLLAGLGAIGFVARRRNAA